MFKLQEEIFIEFKVYLFLSPQDEVNKMAYENLQKGQKREVIVESPVSDIIGGSE